jgi:hypothetical protein
MSITIEARTEPPVTPANHVADNPPPQLAEWVQDVHRLADRQGIAAGTTSERLCALATSLGRVRQ